jgi:hypothetical protein
MPCKRLTKIVPSLIPYTYNSLKTMTQVFMKFDVGEFWEKILSHFSFGYNQICGTLCEDCAFLHASSTYTELLIITCGKHIQADRGLSGGPQ